MDADLDGAPLWPATACIPGPALAARSAAEGAMDEPRLRAPAAALAEALESIHSCGLVHRDLRPGNIIMAADGPRVLDFGIARAVESPRLTATGTAFGTPGFLAPEQALGHDVTGAADMFAPGAVLVAAAGGSACGEGTPMGLMYRSAWSRAAWRRTRRPGRPPPPVDAVQPDPDLTRAAGRPGVRPAGPVRRAGGRTRRHGVPCRRQRHRGPSSKWRAPPATSNGRRSRTSTTS
ncbi:protein kinase [Streptomyces sp. NPDC001307]|uniref:protein kinase domain-containing protein n=1 Tax=Streptomyces sp. NPDC001307 TaxID=3364560 RepID=UPI0036AD77F6